MFNEEAGGHLLSKASNLRRRGGRHDFSTFDEDNVQATTHTINSAWNMIQRDLGNPHADVSNPYYRSRLQILRAQALHNKRCMCAYFKARIDHIATSSWGMRGIDEFCDPTASTEGAQGSDIPKSSLSEAEKEFLKKYEALNVSYMKALGGVDIRLASRGHPPAIQRHIVLKGLQDYIGISNVSGRTIEIYPGKCLNLIFEDAVPLLASGVAEEILPADGRR